MEAAIPDVAVATAIRSISEWCDGDSKKRQLFHWDYLHRLKIGKGREREREREMREEGKTCLLAYCSF